MTVLFTLLISSKVFAMPPVYTIPECRLTVSLDIPSARVSGKTTILISPGQKVAIRTGLLDITSVSIDGKPAEPDRLKKPLASHSSTSSTIEIEFQGTFPATPQIGESSEHSSSIIGKDGIFLTGTWHPSVIGLCRYQLNAEFPPGYKAVSEADRIDEFVGTGSSRFSFFFPHPIDGITLVGSNNYKVIKDRYKNVQIFGYFFTEDLALARTYVDHTKKYLALYEARLGQFPFKRFSIVENFLPTGYSMPTFTLLGQEVVRLPFIVETSLGHEILHQWFGSGVYVDPNGGNWSEGLTAYLSDHLYDQMKGRGIEHRKQLLVGYASYVNQRNEFPLKDFVQQTDFASRAIGYGKGAMVFHMLRLLVDDDAFDRSLQEFITRNLFQQASWSDLQAAFEMTTGRDLSGFFRQWVGEKGLPAITVESAKASPAEDGYEIKMTFVQKGTPYNLALPLIVKMSFGEFRQNVQLDGERTSVKLLSPGMPDRVIIDGDYDVARQLTPEELPATLSRFLGDDGPLIVLPPEGTEPYSNLIADLTKRGGREKISSELTDSEMRSNSLVILGVGNSAAQRIFGAVPTSGGFSITVKPNPWKPEKLVTLITGRSAEEIAAAFWKLRHYGKYSRLVFEMGRNIVKETDVTINGIVRTLLSQTSGVAVAAVKDLPEVVTEVAGKKIIYIGEHHDSFSHHMVQLEIIRALHARGIKIAIGMEMFQRPFQAVLDEYVTGIIDERTLLKRSEYFKRWGFDFQLYKPILDFARHNKIPLVALNARRELVEKVGKGGLDALTPEERQEVPRQMDFSDSQYREHLMLVFQQHLSAEERNFDFFHESQILWDETMAETVDDYLRDHTDYLMVVLAGSGHLSEGSGIPKRTFRRSGLNYAIILNDSEIKKLSADYILFPKHLQVSQSPRLMVLLKEESNAVFVTGFPENSVAERAGLKSGDRIISIDAMPVNSVDDIRIHLFYRKLDDTVKVRVLRRVFLLGEREISYDVRL